MIRESRFMCCIWDSYVFNFILLSSLFLIVNKFCNYRYHLFLYSSFDSKKLTNKNKYPRNTRKYWNWNLNLTDNMYKLISIMRKSRFIESSCEREVPILIGAISVPHVLLVWKVSAWLRCADTITTIISCEL